MPWTDSLTMQDQIRDAAYRKLKDDGNRLNAMDRFITSGDYDEDLIDPSTELA